MTSRTTLLIMCLCIVAGLIVAGCVKETAPVQKPVQTPVPTQVQTSVQNPGIPNPASEYCVKVGGKVSIEKDADGSEFGWCAFPNGTRCAEWPLFRGEGCKTSIQDYISSNSGFSQSSQQDKPSHGTMIPNPASEHCVEKLGGISEIKTAADGSQYGICAFKNGTSCEEWALFRGEGCKPVI